MLSLKVIAVENLDEYGRSDSKDNLLKRSRSKRRKDHHVDEYSRTNSKEALLNSDKSVRSRERSEFGRTTSRDNLINRSKGRKKMRRKKPSEKD